MGKKINLTSEKDLIKILKEASRIQKNINMRFEELADRTNLQATTMRGLFALRKPPLRTVLKILRALNYEIGEFSGAGLVEDGTSLLAFGLSIIKDDTGYILKADIRGCWALLNQYRGELNFDLIDRVVNKDKIRDWRNLVINTFRPHDPYREGEELPKTFIEFYLSGTPPDNHLHLSMHEGRVDNVGFKPHPRGNLHLDIDLTKLKANSSYVFDGQVLAEYLPNKKIFLFEGQTISMNYQTLKFDIDSIKPLAELEDEKGVYIKYYPDVRAEMGEGGFNSDEQDCENIKLEEVMLRRIKGDVKNLMMIKTHGTSMEPTIKDGSYIIFRPDENIYDGQVHVVVSVGLLKIKRLHHLPSRIDLISDNPNFSKEVAGKGDSFKVLGRVLLALDVI
ncbi:MAG: hypothetical protein JJV97_00220 [SAR324 cluster bacterium]|nr:hypothetical protein [SAR324 cluster bacterium]